MGADIFFYAEFWNASDNNHLQTTCRLSKLHISFVELNKTNCDQHAIETLINKYLVEERVSCWGKSILPFERLICVK